MATINGYVIAFHNDAENPYHGLSCVTRAISLLKHTLASDLVVKLRQAASHAEINKIRHRTSLESGILTRDAEVLSFIRRKIKKDGESIFLYLTEEEVADFNRNSFSELFVVASVYVTRTHFRITNPELFTRQERTEVATIVKWSQAGALTEVEQQAPEATA